MSFKLLSVAAAVASAFSASVEVAEDFEKLKDYAVQFMDLAEATYGNAASTGKTKLQAVLAACQAVSASVGATWTTGLSDALTLFIEASKAAFNAVQAAVLVISGATMTAPAVVAAPAVAPVVAA